MLRLLLISVTVVSNKLCRKGFDKINQIREHYIELGGLVLWFVNEQAPIDNRNYVETIRSVLLNMLGPPWQVLSSPKRS